jgi:flagellar biosynthesis regulator FlbT
MIKSQSGSKSIQKKIEEKQNEFTTKLYEQIKNNLVEIINDQYGNYVIQKLVEHCDKKIISLMLKKLYYGNNGENNFKNYLLEISINPYGTRALQKMLENLGNNMTEEDINILLKFSQGNIYQMMKDINGNHVIQSIIENIKNKDHLTPIYKEICDNIVNIMKTKSGSCCVFPKILNNINEEDSDKMINCIIDNIEKLINDENANFAIQKIIKLNKNVYNNKIYNYLQDKIVKLSIQKFSSNVIETFIMNIPSFKDKIIGKIIESNSIINLLSDKFGNYIIQKSLSNANSDDFNNIIKIIKSNIKLIKQSSHGKKIYEKLIKSYKQLAADEESLDNSNSNVNSINYSQNSDKTNK